MCCIHYFLVKEWTGRVSKKNSAFNGLVCVRHRRFRLFRRHMCGVKRENRERGGERQTRAGFFPRLLWSAHLPRPQDFFWGGVRRQHLVARLQNPTSFSSSCLVFKVPCFLFPLFVHPAVCSASRPASERARGSRRRQPPPTAGRPARAPSRRPSTRMATPSS